MSILDELRRTEGRETYGYTFHLHACCEETTSSSRAVFSFLFPAGSGTGQVREIRGQVIEHGDDWVRVRQSSGYRQHTDILLPLSSIRYITEVYTAE